MKPYRLIWILLLALVVGGCGIGPEGDTTPAESVPVQTNTPLPPSATETPLAPVGALITPEGSDPNLAAELNSLIAEYIRVEGLRYQVLADLSENDFERDDFQIVVVMPPFSEISTLASDYPDTHFLAVGFNDLDPAENLTVLRSGGGDFDVQGFIAGYIAAMITTDWRVGALSVQEDPDALAAREGFRVGVKYYCGLCNPKYAPTGINYIYPKYIDLPVDATDPQIGANIDFLVDRVVNTFYIVPGVGTQSIYRTLVGYDKLIIGSGSDYREEYQDNWVVSLEYDQMAALVEIWPLFLEAETGFVESPPLLLTDVNYDLLSEGKLRLVMNILEEVQAGFIKTSFED